MRRSTASAGETRGSCKFAAPKHIFLPGCPNWRKLEPAPRGRRHGADAKLGRHRERRGAGRHAAAERQGRQRPDRDLVSGWSSSGWCRMPATMRADRWAMAGSTTTTSPARGTAGSSIAAPASASPGFEQDCVPAFPVKVENGRVLVDVAVAVAAQEGAARAASARPQGRAGGGAAAARRHLDHRDGRGQSALLGLRPPARPCDRGGREAGRRNPAHSAQRSQVPRLRGLLLEGRASLHLAVLDHPDGRRRRARPRLRGAGALGRRRHRRDADPLGHGVIALFQDGRAAELRAERRSPSTTTC